MAALDIPYLELPNELRPADQVIRVVPSLGEGLLYKDLLAHRFIDGIVVQEAFKALIDPCDIQDEELAAFLCDMVEVTRGTASGPIDIMPRTIPRSEASEVEKLRVFTDDTPPHIDAVFTEVVHEDGRIEAKYDVPFPNQMHYPGVCFLLNQTGSFDLVMEKLDEQSGLFFQQIVPAARNALLRNRNIPWPLRGEVATMNPGSLAVLHATQASFRPVYLHGTTNTTEDRIAVSLTPRHRRKSDPDTPAVRLIRGSDYAALDA